MDDNDTIPDPSKDTPTQQPSTKSVGPFKFKTTTTSTTPVSPPKIVNFFFEQKTQNDTVSEKIELKTRPPVSEPFVPLYNSTPMVKDDGGVEVVTKSVPKKDDGMTKDVQTQPIPISKPKPKPKPTVKENEQQIPFNRLLSDMIFSISGLENPLRSDIRSKALSMGARYSPNWRPGYCTHLICPFLNTPKTQEVRDSNEGGVIVVPEFVEECFRERVRVDEGEFVVEKVFGVGRGGKKRRRNVGSDDDEETSDAEDEWEGETEEDEDETEETEEDEYEDDDDDDDYGRSRKKAKVTKSRRKTNTKAQTNPNPTAPIPPTNNGESDFEEDLDGNRIKKETPVIVKKEITEPQQPNDPSKPPQIFKSFLFMYDKNSVHPIKMKIIDRYIHAYGGTVATEPSGNVTHYIVDLDMNPPENLEEVTGSKEVVVVNTDWVVERHGEVQGL